MLIKITERNAWERESWSHVLDVSKQSGQALNHLLTFTRLANAQFEEAKKSASQAGHGSMFAASRYDVQFYETHEENERSFRLNNSNGPTMVISKNSGYKSSVLDLETKISPAKMKSAMTKMRDKKENVLYKSFESVMLKSKKKKSK
jgi:hypothetical protein